MSYLFIYFWEQEIALQKTNDPITSMGDQIRQNNAQSTS